MESKEIQWVSYFNSHTVILSNTIKCIQRGTPRIVYKQAITASSLRSEPSKFFFIYC